MDLPYTRILLATEHTEFDAGAERVAFELARHCGAPLAGVLPLVTNTEYEVVAPELAAQAEARAFARLGQVRAAAAAAGVALDLRVRQGEDAAREIVAEAERGAADLIVARRRGRQGFLAKLRVGEMVTRVATEAPCDVLLVPRAARMWSRRVLVAVDASPAAERVAETAARIAARCALPLTVATVTAHDGAAERGGGRGRRRPGDGRRRALRRGRRAPGRDRPRGRGDRGARDRDRRRSRRRRPQRSGPAGTASPARRDRARRHRPRALPGADRPDLTAALRRRPTG